METIFMQNFGGTNKEYYGIFESGLLCLWILRCEVQDVGVGHV